ncbi:hypothetical protein LK10_11255 [Sinomonas humi]|uniref:Uncharacterized protein n=1 Tax=Sinomonas humi TaxID=1338436 RepID=A0A0B2AMK4_9MICC|nr:hypothetical protein LK10_11255 [Sinomonas humi]
MGVAVTVTVTVGAGLGAAKAVGLVLGAGAWDEGAQPVRARMVAPAIAAEISLGFNSCLPSGA